MVEGDQAQEIIGHFVEENKRYGKVESNLLDL